MLWGREVARDLTNYVVLDYCQYNGPGYRKRTRIAHSGDIRWNPRPLCEPKACGQCADGKQLVTAQRGSCKGKDKRLDRCSLVALHGLPRKLTEEMLADNHMWQLI